MFPISFRCFKYEKCQDLDKFLPYFVYFLKTGLVNLNWLTGNYKMTG